MKDSDMSNNAAPQSSQPIAVRLRRTAAFITSQTGDPAAWVIEAADRIEELEAALGRIERGGTSVLLDAALNDDLINPDVLQKIVTEARAALPQSSGVARAEK